MAWATVHINEFGHKVTVKHMSAKKERRVGGIRGTIRQFTSAARRRLLDWLREMEVPDRLPVCLTLTTQEVKSPADWRLIMDNWNKAISRRGWAGTWRVELQARSAPHVHALLWIPESVDLSTLPLLWCKVCGGSSDVLLHGCLVRHYDMSTAWLLYVAGHAAKSDQSGWMGKQWGIWNRKMFVKRREHVFEMTYAEYSAFMELAEQRNKEVGGKVELGECGHMRVGQLGGMMGRGAVALAKRRAKEREKE